LSSPYESADLLLKLYELRREPTMREARAWFAADFNPTTFEEVQQALFGPKSGHFRMVSSYWDMAASFVNNGAINEQMFGDANGEHNVVFAKLEPFLGPYREMMGNPNSFAQMEKLVMKAPGAAERMASIRERFRAMAASRAKAAAPKG
jgi:hypothetical protein